MVAVGIAEPGPSGIPAPREDISIHLGGGCNPEVHRPVHAAKILLKEACGKTARSSIEATWPDGRSSV